MTHTTRISLPQEVSLGDIITAKICPVCMNANNARVTFGVGSKNASDSDHQISKHTSETINLICDKDHVLKFKVTNEMVAKQRANKLNGVYATQTTGKGINTEYFRIKVPGAIMGRVQILRSYSIRRSRRGEPIAMWYVDIYHNGIASQINYDYGDGYANPEGRIMDEYTGQLARQLKYIRQSLYDSRASNPEEKTWMDTHLIVVPNDWTPMDGLPQPDIDPCEGVECGDVCDDVTLYTQTCEGGVCVKGDIVTQNAAECGYVPPPHEPEPEPPTDEPTDDVIDEPTDHDIPTEPTDPDIHFDIQALLDSMGLSMKHAKYAIVVLIIIFIMSRLA
jgi:hypothetical protein